METKNLKEERENRNPVASTARAVSGSTILPGFPPVQSGGDSQRDL